MHYGSVGTETTVLADSQLLAYVIIRLCFGLMMIVNIEANRNHKFSTISFCKSSRRPPLPAQSIETTPH